MSSSGQNEDRGFSRGRGRGRGRGKRTMLWEYELYKPGPEVYEQLWRLRKEPAIVTSRLPHESPVPNAETRILDRTQTEGIRQEVYKVSITYHDQSLGNQVEYVDSSRIQHYVSPFELERFENEDFRMIQEAETAVWRQDAAERAQKNLSRNSRAATRDERKELLADVSHASVNRTGRGQSRGRPRGRAGRRGNWQGRQATILSTHMVADDAQGDLSGTNRSDMQAQVEEATLRVIADSEEEDSLENDSIEDHGSPSIMRSAFVTNSALPVSPVNSYHHQEIGILEDEDSEDDDSSQANVSDQLHLENSYLKQSRDDDTGEHSLEDEPSRKRRRTGSMSSYNGTPLGSMGHALKAPGLAQTSSNRPKPVKAAVSHRARQSPSRHSPDSDTIHVRTPANVVPIMQQEDSEDQDESESDAQEYAVEAVLEHYVEDGTKYYLVKWEGYEDSHDWLPEEELQGAAGIVEDYNRQVRRKKRASMLAIPRKRSMK